MMASFLKQIFGRASREEGLINTTDLLVATAATVVLAAGVGGAVLSTLDEASYGKAQPDAQALAQAVMSFYKDTGKWPGQAEHASNTNLVVLLATGPTAGSTATSAYSLPQLGNDGLKWEALPTGTTCAANSGEGFVNATVAEHVGVSSTGPIASSTRVYNINDYLVRAPSSSSYPNWGGPYVQEIHTDPWDRSWVAYLTPLYCSETITATTTPKLGYAWLLTGGSNRTITTSAQASNLDAAGDDAGVNLGKLSTQSSGTVSQ